MAEKVPSLKNGGAFWFTNLCGPDSFYIFPILTGLTLLIIVERNLHGMIGDPANDYLKNVLKAFAICSAPLTNDNVFTTVLKAPGVKKFLGVPQISVAPPTTTAPPK